MGQRKKLGGYSYDDMEMGIDIRVHLQSLGGGRTLFPIIKIGLYDCPGMQFRGSYSLLLV